MSGAYGRALEAAAREVGDLFETVVDLPVAPAADPEEIRRHLRDRFDFGEPREEGQLVREVAGMMRRWSLHVTHPRYFGLFNPGPHPVTLAADALTAAFNPQLAVWPHAPAANEMEAHVLGLLAKAARFDPDASHATFTSGGQEANHTAVVAALAGRFPDVSRDGLRSLGADPVLYLSAEGHHSIEKSASAVGLGRRAVRRIPVDDQGRMRPGALGHAIADDREAGRIPFLVVATAGTTGEGAVDPLEPVAAIARDEGLWLHVDAAWAGSALLSRKARSALAGVEHADSLTWDAHKWLWAPIGTGMFFCRHPEAVERPFALRAGYVPPSPDGTRDRLSSTLQWSRRFAGLRVFMTLAALGMEGVEALIDHQIAMGEALRGRLGAEGWSVVNHTVLPVVCFTHPRIEEGEMGAQEIAERVCSRERAWISSLRTAGGADVLRACITSYRVQEADLDVLMEELERASSTADRGSG